MNESVSWPHCAIYFKPTGLSKTDSGMMAAVQRSIDNILPLEIVLFCCGQSNYGIEFRGIACSSITFVAQ